MINENKIVNIEQPYKKNSATSTKMAPFIRNIKPHRFDS